jgi:hypothetical protein
MAGSTRVTGNDPLEGVDPGGTRPTSKAGREGKPGGAEPKTEQKVQSGDRNSLRDGQGAVDDDEARRRNPERKS